VKAGRPYALAALLFLVPAVTTGAWAKASHKHVAGPITIRVKAVKGQIEYLYRGRRLTSSGFDQLCLTSRKEKIEIEFQKDRMNSDQTLASLLREAQCLGTTHVSAPAPKPAAHTHAIPRRKAAVPQ
jgi:hypothetical protein